jgi:hypothetical protein
VIALVTLVTIAFRRRVPARLTGDSATLLCVPPTPTAPIAGGTLIVGYAIAASTGSRPLGGIVLLVGGMWCVRTWIRRNGAGTAATLACVGLGAFVFSHLLALAIGAWPAVLLTAATMATAAWTQADTRAIRSRDWRAGS